MIIDKDIKFDNNPYSRIVYFKSQSFTRNLFKIKFNNINKIRIKAYFMCHLNKEYKLEESIDITISYTIKDKCNNEIFINEETMNKPSEYPLIFLIDKSFDLNEKMDCIELKIQVIYIWGTKYRNFLMNKDTRSILSGYDWSQ